MPYNPITLEYENSDKGQELKVKDEKSQVNNRNSLNNSYILEKIRLERI